LQDDFVQLVADWPRARFVEHHPFPFLVGAASLNEPQSPHKTQRWSAEQTLAAVAGSRKPIVLGVRKTQEVFPHMITIGRTRNNDVVIADVLVSKFHAFFRRGPDGAWELSDAGSANGTRVAGVELERRGPGRPVKLGERVAFASAELKFVDAGGCWDLVRLQLGSR
jgi:pSer/pThr/pTyr-binding forkhead associated (FHA) protein